jgi:AcrR family transcriptional regulator
MIHFFVMPYRPTERTEARRRETRQRILTAAHDQVAEAGYGSASVQGVAARAGVATGTVYRHFDSKADLFAEVFREAAQRELDVVASVAGQPGPSVAHRIAAAGEAFARRALAAPTLAYALLAEPVDPAVEAERLRLRRGHREVYAQVLDEGVASGELSPMDTGVVGAALVGAFAEALVGPLSQDLDLGNNGAQGHEALIASLVQFSLNAVHKEESDVRDHIAA